MSFFSKDKEVCEDPFKDKVKCGECRCWIDKSDASVVDWNGYSSDYYCPTHAKPYERVLCDHFGSVVRYYSSIEVTREGTPVGYVKEKPTKTTK